MSQRLKQKAPVYYKGLNNSSTATELEILDTGRKRNNKNVYRAEEVLAEKKIGKRTYYLVMWYGWGSDDCTWEPTQNLLDVRLLHFWEHPAPDMRQVDYYVERLLSCFETALKERLRSVKVLDFPVAIFRYLFHGRGVDKKRGNKSLNEEDFDPHWFPNNWHSGLINKRGTKRIILFPVVVRSFLSKSPKLYQKHKSGEVREKKQRIIQRLSVTIFKDTFNSY
eukprot:TCONS_00006272-protein